MVAAMFVLAEADPTTWPEAFMVVSIVVSFMVFMCFLMWLVMRRN